MFSFCLAFFKCLKVLSLLQADLLVIVSSQFVDGGSCRTQLTFLANLNTATYSRSKSLLMVFGARVVIARQTRIAKAGIKMLRYKLRDKKREECLLLHSYILAGIFFRCFGFFFGRIISSTQFLRSALTSS